VPAGEASRFDILPAIDLVGGRVVRLRQGDFERAAVYSDDPVDVAKRFEAAGARWLHIVDLYGAREARPRQVAVIAQILDALGGTMRVEVAGGLRTAEAAQAALDAGAWRVVLGTAALRDPAFAARLVAGHGADRVAVAVDVRDGLAIGNAWRKGAGGLPVRDTVERLAGAGVRVFETTAIDRDGLLAGPDLELLQSVFSLGVEVIASGGIRSVADLDAVRSIGCTGAIVGRALYDGTLDVEAALTATR
jgi:phosphoribosylformimino-5-aminoimidazole carboxamide ribotide isomerase